MNYQTVFEISIKTFPWGFPLFGVAGFLFGMAMSKGMVKVRKGNGFGGGRLLMVASACWSLFAFGLVYVEYQHLNSAYKTGKTSIAEGVVRDFEITHPGRGEKDIFFVNGIRFEVSGFVSSGFEKTTAGGSVLKSGVPVRITYTNQNGKNRIVKLEVTT